MLKPDSRIFKTRDIPWKIIGDEGVLVDTDEGEVVRLSEVGAEIWKYIDGKRTVGDLINHIYETFDAKKETVEKDVSDFLNKLIRMELIKPHN